MQCTDFLGIVVALAVLAGAYLSKKLVTGIEPEKIILIGVIILIFGCLLVTCVNFLPESIQITVMIISVSIILFGTGTSLPNCLSFALVDFQDIVGTVGAIFSLEYYTLVSIIIYGMSVFHNGTIFAMLILFRIKVEEIFNDVFPVK